MGDRLQRKVIDRLERTFSVTLEAESGEWSFDGSVELRGLVVRDKGAPPGEEPLLRVDSLRVTADVSLWARKARLTDLVMDGVQARILRRRDGSTNVLGVLKGLAKLGRRGAGAQGGTPLSFIERSIPKVSVTDLQVQVQAGAAPAGWPAEVPLEALFREGELHLENTSLMREEDNISLQARFAGTSLGDTGELEVKAQVTLDAGLEAFSLHFERPATVPVGAREIALQGMAYQRNALRHRLDVMGITVQDAGRERVGATLHGLRVHLDPSKGVVAMVRQLREEGLTQGGLNFVQRVELRQPTLFFESPDVAGELAKLKGSMGGGRGAGDQVEAPDKAMGILMAASRAAAQRLSGRAKGEGPRLQKFVNRNWERLKTRLLGLAPVVKWLLSAVPVHNVIVTGGHFSWAVEDARAGMGSGVAPFENFNVTFLREPGKLTVMTLRFVTPGGTKGANQVTMTLNLATGDTQLNVSLEGLRLHPYRHVFPTALAVSEQSQLKGTDATLIWSPAEGRVKAFGKLAIDDVSIYSPRLAEKAMTGLDVKFSWDATLDTRANALSLHSLNASMGSMGTSLAGTATHLNAYPRFAGTFRLARMRCQDLVDALPAGFIPHLKRMKVTGTFGGLLTFECDTSRMDELTYDTFPALHGFSVTDTGVLDFEAVTQTFTHRLQEADGTLREFQVGPDAPHWVGLDDISPYLVKAITTTEDASFFRHNGFSTYAIRQSIITNLKKGGFFRGASTVSQQLVKNLFLSRAKTISRKLEEMFITWRVEKLLPKKRIMALYLNVIELGPGIYGIKHAARHYFDKLPGELTLLECVFIASVIPSPNRYYQQFARGEVTPAWRRYLRTLIGIMHQRGKITQAEYQNAAPYSPVFRGAKGADSSDEQAPAPPVFPWGADGAPGP